jgi:hypothetical protein
MIAVLSGAAKPPTRLDRVPHDLAKLRKWRRTLCAWSSAVAFLWSVFACGVRLGRRPRPGNKRGITGGHWREIQHANATAAFVFGFAKP